MDFGCSSTDEPCQELNYVLAWSILLANYEPTILKGCHKDNAIICYMTDINYKTSNISVDYGAACHCLSAKSN